MEPGVALLLVLAALAALMARQAQQNAEPKAVPVRVEENESEPPTRG